MREPVVTLFRHGELDPVEPDDVLVTVDVGPHGEALALWSAAADREALRSATVSPGWATFPNARTPHPVAARVTVQDPGHARLVSIPELELAHPFVQPLPGGRVLMVAARCTWRASGPDRNAVVFDDAGTPVAAATLGDGVQHVLATPSGNVWAGYFDEGIFGNYGWGGPGPEPIGAAGIVRWRPDLTEAWRYPYDSGLGDVYDCYALNVTGEQAWAYYYDSFPVVRISGDEVQGWRNSVAGAGALTVGDSTAALVGGYGERWRITVGRLADGVFESTSTGRLALEGGNEPAPATRIVARGPDLHVFIGPTWYRADLG